jgi:hypothetical protein
VKQFLHSLKIYLMNPIITNVMPFGNANIQFDCYEKDFLRIRRFLISEYQISRICIDSENSEKMEVYFQVPEAYREKLTHATFLGFIEKSILEEQSHPLCREH